MVLGKVIGTVVAERKYEGLSGIKLMMVQPLDDCLEHVGRPIVAVDTVCAGPNELVFLAQSREAANALDESFVPVDAAIVGIVDCLDHEP